MIKKIIFFAAYLVTRGLTASAQNNDACDIYRIALDSLYTWSSNITVDTATANYPIDPENPPKEKDQKLATLKMDFIVNLNHIVPFNKYDMMNWFARLIDNPDLLKNQNGLTESKSSCDFSKSDVFKNSNYCVTVNPNEYNTGDYTSYFECSKKNGEKEKKVDINPSSLLFSKDGKTVYVYFLRKEGKEAGESSRWAFVLKKTTGKWVISKMSGMPLE